MKSEGERPVNFIDVLGKRMAYVEMGEGDPIVFQHGNPTSSYLWRNIMPHVREHGRCIALDRIGMGDSDKLDGSGPDRYTFVEHRSYFDAALEALGVSKNVRLVVHDWGSALGFDWANRHRDRVTRLCYMEGIVCPIASWDDWPEAARQVFRGFRPPMRESGQTRGVLLAPGMDVSNPCKAIEITRRARRSFPSSSAAPLDRRRPPRTALS